MIQRQQSAPHGTCGEASLGSVSIPAHAIAGRRLLITGAGGSIGAALAHAVAVRQPEMLLLMDSSEQALYRIDRELGLPHTSILANVCDAPAIQEAFTRHRPQIVFHAAAFKHVPMMERHPFAAVKNNAVGTYTLAQAATQHGAEQMVILSTDKAVEPASIMGVSKRIAELIALAFASPATMMKALRLGNVYGSQGSVVPLFEEQIAHGGPVTVTHPAATRYFLKLDEAAALLILALSDEFPSGILVPELAQPVRVEQVARELIEKSGSQAAIVHVGLRPGEKLNEKLLATDESFQQDGIGPLRTIRSGRISREELLRGIEELQQAVAARDLSQLLRVVQGLVPKYKPSEMILAQQAAAGCRA